MQLGVLFAEFLVLELQLCDPSPQLFGLVIWQSLRAAPKPHFASPGRTSNHESTYKHTRASMESHFFVRSDAAR
jgi:hypothetical protein